jgi:hypothetical protein
MGSRESSHSGWMARRDQAAAVHPGQSTCRDAGVRAGPACRWKRPQRQGQSLCRRPPQVGHYYADSYRKSLLTVAPANRPSSGVRSSSRVATRFFTAPLALGCHLPWTAMSRSPTSSSRCTSLRLFRTIPCTTPRLVFQRHEDRALRRLRLLAQSHDAAVAHLRTAFDPVEIPRRHEPTPREALAQQGKRMPPQGQAGRGIAEHDLFALGGRHRVRGNPRRRALRAATRAPNAAPPLPTPVGAGGSTGPRAHSPRPAASSRAVPASRAAPGPPCCRTPAVRGPRRCARPRPTRAPRSCAARAAPPDDYDARAIFSIALSATKAG